ALAVAGHREDAIVTARAGEHDSHGVAALGGHLGHGRAYHLAAGENHQDLVVLGDDQTARENAALVAQLGHLDAGSAALLHLVLVGAGALRVAAVGHGEHVRVLGDDGCRQQAVLVVLELHAAHALGGPAHRTQRLVGSVEAYRHA